MTGPGAGPGRSAPSDARQLDARPLEARPLDARQLDARLRKSAVVWVRPEGHGDRLVWAVWPGRGPFAGTLLLAHGGDEQDVPGLADGVSVTVTLTEPGTRTALARITTVARAVTDPAADEALRGARRNGSPQWAQVVALALTDASPAGRGPARG